MRLRTTSSWVVIGITFALVRPAAAGSLLSPPVDALLRNVEAYAHEHPNDAEGYYQLGRLHYLAYVEERYGLAGSLAKGFSLQDSLEDVTTLPRLNAEYAPLGTAEQQPPRREHLTQALDNLRKAVQLDGTNASFPLTLASLLEYGAADAAVMTNTEYMPPGDSALTRKIYPATLKRFEALLQAAHPAKGKPSAESARALEEESCFGVRVVRMLADKGLSAARLELVKLRERCWHERALESYWGALHLAAQGAIARSSPGRIVPEAAAGFLRLVKERGVRDSDKDRMAWVEKNLRWFTSRPQQRSMNALIFPLAATTPFAKLMSDDPVSFDVDGSGPERLTWVNDDAGLLVWDPTGSGTITNGRQLIGSGWLFTAWPDGYRVLDAFDSNRDGYLAGDELKGFAVWVDRNENGVCDPGEIRTLEKLGIVEIATRPSGKGLNDHGLKLRDGTTLPTYSWAPEFAPVSTAQQ